MKQKTKKKPWKVIAIVLIEKTNSRPSWWSTRTLLFFFSNRYISHMFFANFFTDYLTRKLNFWRTVKTRLNGFFVYMTPRFYMYMNDISVYVLRSTLIMRETSSSLIIIGNVKNVLRTSRPTDVNGRIHFLISLLNITANVGIHQLTTVSIALSFRIRKPREIVVALFTTEILN